MAKEFTLILISEYQKQYPRLCKLISKVINEPNLWYCAAYLYKYKQGSHPETPLIKRILENRHLYTLWYT